MHAPGDVRVVEREDPKIIEPTDAIIRITATCVCGSDLWPYRGVEPIEHTLMCHEYVGIVEEIGDAVLTLTVGDFVVGSFCISDNRPSTGPTRATRRWTTAVPSRPCSPSDRQSQPPGVKQR